MQIVNVAESYYSYLQIKYNVFQTCAWMDAFKQKYGRSLSFITKQDSMTLEPYFFAKESFF